MVIALVFVLSLKTVHAGATTADLFSAASTVFPLSARRLVARWTTRL